MSSKLIGITLFVNALKSYYLQLNSDYSLN